MKEIEPMEGTSLDITQDLIQNLREIIPGAFTEDKINVEQLKQLLGEAINTDAERYQLSWAGKNDAYKVLQAQTTATLAPIVADSVNWDITKNIFIEGENLEVLKILQKSYFGKIDFIIIDPPYNTGSDKFIYPDKFSETKEEYLKRINEKDAEGNLLKEGLYRANRKENGQFHSNWLSMMLPRLFLARNLLSDLGVIAINIDSNESHSLKLLLDEIFGENNFVSELIWKKKGGAGNTETLIGNITESIFVYAKNIDKVTINKRDIDKDFQLKDTQGFYTLEGILKTDSGAYKRDTMKFGIENPETKEIIYPPTGKRWTIGEKTKDEYLKQGLLAFIKDKYGSTQVKFKKYLTDNGVSGVFLNLITDKGSLETAKDEIANLKFDREVFDTPKPTMLIEHLLSMFCHKTATVLDFFGGSGTTAHAVLNYNYKNNANLNFIIVQLPELIKNTNVVELKNFESIATLSFERIKRVINYYNSSPNLFNNQFNHIGVRFFKQTESNFKIWRSDFIQDEKDLLDQLNLFSSSIRNIEPKLSIVWEILIKNGFNLSHSVELVKIGSDNIYKSQDNKVVILVDSVSNEILEFIISSKPNYVIALDLIFQNNDSFKTNFLIKLQDNNISFKSL